MKILQSLNQNALLVEDNGQECIVVGKGIGFGKKKGDTVKSDEVNKYYQIRTNDTDLMDSIDENTFLISENITSYASQVLAIDFSGNFIIALASHIQFVEEKYQTINEIKEPFHYELKYLYPKEYEVATWALNYLINTCGFDLPQAEISFLTLHFVSGSVEEKGIKNVVELSEVLNAIVEIIENNIQHLINRETIEFSRFIVHLRYFVMRHFSGETIEEKKENDEVNRLYELSFEMYPLERQIIEKIKLYLNENYDVTFGKAEDFYLLLHLVRIINY